jgi:hypothetical protein
MHHIQTHGLSKHSVQCVPKTHFTTALPLEYQRQCSCKTAHHLRHMHALPIASDWATASYPTGKRPHTPCTIMCHMSVLHQRIHSWCKTRSLTHMSLQQQPSACMRSCAASSRPSGKPHCSSGTCSQRMPCRQLLPHSLQSGWYSWGCCTPP